MNTRMKVLFLGNGLCRAYGGEDWKRHLHLINTNPRIDILDAKYERVPYSLKAVIATDDKISDVLSTDAADKLLFGLETIDTIREPICSLVNLGFDHILTTNYSYEIERSLDSDFQRQGTYKGHLIRDFNKVTSMSGLSSPEEKYFLHTFNELSYNHQMQKIWHIHGEGRKKDSIVLGQDMYGKLLGQYVEELKRYDSLPLPQEVVSWLDAFILGDIYILGFGFDYSEIDLWWLLSKRKQIAGLDSGEIVFYEPDDGTSKYDVLKTYGVTVSSLGRSASTSYTKFYDDCINDISKRIGASI